MPKSAGVCRFEDCRSIGQGRLLPYAPEGLASSVPGAVPQSTKDAIEICGGHWPEVRAKTEDRTHWLAVLRDGALQFDPARGQI